MKFLLVAMFFLSFLNNKDYTELFQQANACFERGKPEDCQQILSELSNMGISRIQRRKVASLMVDNSLMYFHKDHSVNLLNSDFIKHNLDRTDYKNYSVLLQAPSMHVLWYKTKETVVPIINIGPKQNPLYGIKAIVNGHECVGIIDNCSADYCYATKEFAVRNGIVPINYKLKINGKESGFIGIADSLSIGEMTLQNVLFIVSDVNNNLKANYDFDITIGSNVMRAIGDITINNVDNVISFSSESVGIPQNIYMLSEGHTYYTDVNVNEEGVKMMLDFGCSRTHMNSKYYNDRKEIIHKDCVESEISFALVSHVETSKSYIIDSGIFDICGFYCEIKDIHIQISSTSKNGLDGSIGTDILRKFEYVKFNASKLYLLLLHNDI